MYLDAKGFTVPSLYMFGKLNIGGMLRICHLNQWLDIEKEFTWVYVESGDETKEQHLDNHHFNQIYFETIDELLK